MRIAEGKGPGAGRDAGRRTHRPFVAAGCAGDGADRAIMTLPDWRDAAVRKPGCRA